MNYDQIVLLNKLKHTPACSVLIRIQGLNSMDFQNQPFLTNLWKQNLFKYLLVNLPSFHNNHVVFLFKYYHDYRMGVNHLENKPLL